MDAPERKCDPVDDDGDGTTLPVRARDPRAPDPDRDARWAAWRHENAGAIAAWNAYVEEHGLPLARYRLF